MPLSMNDDFERFKKYLATLGLAIPVGLACAQLRAAEYAAQWSLGLGYEHDDNVRLEDSNSESITGYTVTPDLLFTYRTPSLEVGLNTLLSFAEFDEEQYSSDDQKVILDVEKSYKNSALDLQLGVNRESTRTSELLDTGVVASEAVRREDFWLAPGWQHNLSERHAVELAAKARTVDFETEEFADYDYRQLDIGWVYQWSARSDLNIKVYTGEYETDSAQTHESDINGIRIGFKSQLTANLDLFGNLGLANIEAERELIGGGSEQVFDDNFFLMEGGLEYTQQRYKLSVALTRDARPSGGGLMQEVERLEFRYRYALTEHMDWELNGLLGRNTSQDDSFENERDYGDAATALTFQISRSWFLSGRYRYRYQDRENRPDSADSNAFYLTIEYKPQMKKWSR